MCEPAERVKLTSIQMMTYNGVLAIGGFICLQFFTYAVDLDYFRRKYESFVINIAYAPAIGLFIVGFICAQIYYLFRWSSYRDIDVSRTNGKIMI